MIKVKRKTPQEKLAEWQEVFRIGLESKKLKGRFRAMVSNAQLFYEKVESLINKRIDKQNIKTTLKEVAKETGTSYYDHVGRFLGILDESEAGNLFRDVFYDDFTSEEAFQGALRHLAVQYMMRFGGLKDMVYAQTPVWQEREKEHDRLFKIVYQYALADVPLLIIGETGTSKNLMARVVHKVSKRRKKELVEINCAALPDTMIESELFGHEEGAFTGAGKQQKGALEVAHGGTVVLDELSKMALHAQGKLLKALEEKEIHRLGGDRSHPVKIDVRFIATAQPGDIKGNDGTKILPDLLYRLGYPDVLTMPNLNQRLRHEPEYVIQSSLEVVLEKLDIRDEISVNEEIVSMLRARDYKGNFRELENVLRRAVVSARIDGRNEIQAKDVLLDEEDRRNEAPDTGLPLLNPEALRMVKTKDLLDYLQDMTKEITTRVLRERMYEIKRSARTLKSVVMEEGLAEEEYGYFCNKLKTFTGGMRTIDRH